jgi:PPOX class probable FMN-dependent enzyme
MHDLPLTIRSWPDTMIITSDEGGMARIETVERLREIITDYGPRGAAKIRDHICEQGTAFIERSPFLMLGTLGDCGLEISQKGGDPGFVKIRDSTTLLIPERAGNHLAIGLQNILRDPRVALAMIRPATDEVLRLSGRATLHDDAELCEWLSADGKPATLIIRVEVERAAFHCVRSARRANLWNPESWDKPTRISFGKIYADALAQPELEPLFDKLTEESDSKLY